MKKIISGLLVVVILVMIGVPAAVASRHYLEAQFEWYLDREGRLVLDASCSEGRIEKYRWEIRDRDCNYLVERGRTRIFRTSIEENYYGPGRYWVTLTVTDRHGRKDSIRERVTIRQKYQYRRRRRRKEICLTKEERALAWWIIGLAVVVSVLKDD